MRPFHQDEFVTLYHGDSREILPRLHASVIITDPPYGETSLDWDEWPRGWVEAIPSTVNSMWCFGSLRMFLEKREEFAAWRLAQEIVWEKHNGTNSQNDRFRRVHELAAHFYRGDWSSVFKAPVFTNDAIERTVRRKTKLTQWGGIGESSFRSEDGGPRLARSVIYCRSCHGQAMHPTQKPEGIIRPLVEYSAPVGSVICDPFAGSGTTLLVSRSLGLRSVGVEANEKFCEIAAIRLRQEVFQLGN